MTAPAVTYTFTNNTTADGSQVSTNFSDLVTYVSNRNDGTTAWDRVLVTAAAASVPLVVNNASQAVNVATFQDAGSQVAAFCNDGGLALQNRSTILTSTEIPASSGGIYFKGGVCALVYNNAGTMKSIKIDVNAEATSWGAGTP